MEKNIWSELEAHTEALYELNNLAERDIYLTMLGWSMDMDMAKHPRGAEIFRLSSQSFRFSWTGIGLRASWEEVKRSMEHGGRAP